MNINNKKENSNRKEYLNKIRDKVLLRRDTVNKFKCLYQELFTIL
jgi:hypothetical protein